jgi:hypothetical protein
MPTTRRGGQTFGRVAPVVNTRRGSTPTRTDVRYYQERAGQAQSMQKVIGTTNAPSSDHQLTGFTADGYAIWEKKAAPAPQQSAPAPAPAPAPSGPSARELQITKEAEAYKKATEEKLAAADATIAKLSDEEEQRRLAAELQNRLQIQAQASARRGQQQAALQIGSSATPRTAGTAAFKRRGDRMRLAPIQSTAGINVPSGSVLNV